MTVGEGSVSEIASTAGTGPQLRRNCVDRRSMERKN